MQYILSFRKYSQPHLSLYRSTHKSLSILVQIVQNRPAVLFSIQRYFLIPIVYFWCNIWLFESSPLGLRPSFLKKRLDLIYNHSNPQRLVQCHGTSVRIRHPKMPVALVFISVRVFTKKIYKVNV